MFKKPYKVSQQNVVGKKDRQKLKEEIELSCSLGKGELESLLPADRDIVMLKLDTRSLLFCSGDANAPPLFIDSEGRGKVVPSLMSLWRFPDMCKRLTIHGPTSKFVLKGADLMLPGVIVPEGGLPPLAEGDTVALFVEGNPYAIAVGKMVVDSAYIEENGMKGRGMQLVHVYRDELWAQCGGLSPNAGFGAELVEECGDTGFSESGSAAPPAAAAEPEACKDEAPPPVAESSAPATADMSPDELFEHCFMMALHGTEDSKFPYEASKFYANEIQPRRPEGTTVDVKKTSHKNLGKFLNAKRKLKLIDVVDKKGVISVTKVNRDHPAYTSFEYSPPAEAAPAAAAKDGAKGGASKKPGPKVLQMWKPTHYMEPLYVACGRSKGAILPLADALKILHEYIEKNDLGGGEMIKIDETLQNALYKVAGGKKKGAAEDPTEAVAAELEARFQERLTEFTVVELPNAPRIEKKGPFQPILITTTRKGGHNLTRATGLELFGVDIERMAQELKKKLNCTTSVEDLPGKQVKEKLLQVQGYCEGEIIEYLKNEYGVEKKWVDVKN
mmetsp:Transcript_65173/g.174793  ORF Transcript_65173/g.174793 Transcript_65173/m.174793 type:complete len:558 (-) Transcript_65173:97-1770(-)